MTLKIIKNSQYLVNAQIEISRAVFAANKHQDIELKHLSFKNDVERMKYIETHVIEAIGELQQYLKNK